MPRLNELFSQHLAQNNLLELREVIEAAYVTLLGEPEPVQSRLDWWLRYAQENNLSAEVFASEFLARAAEASEDQLVSWNTSVDERDALINTINQAVPNASSFSEILSAVEAAQEEGDGSGPEPTSPDMAMDPSSPLMHYFYQGSGLLVPGSPYSIQRTSPNTDEIEVEGAAQYVLDSFKQEGDTTTVSIDVDGRVVSESFAINQISDITWVINNGQSVTLERDMDEVPAFNVATGATLAITSDLLLGGDNFTITGGGVVSAQAIHLANGTLDASGFTGGLTANLHASGGNVNLLLGTGEEAYSLNRETTEQFNLTSTSITSDEGIEISGFNAGNTHPDNLHISSYTVLNSSEAAFTNALNTLTADSGNSFKVGYQGINASMTVQYYEFTEIGGGDVQITNTNASITGSIVLEGVGADLVAENISAFFFV